MNDDEESKIDKHFGRARVVVSAIAVAVTVGLALASLVDDIQRGLGVIRVDHQRDYGELRSLIKGCLESQAERGVRLMNLEREVYDLLDTREHGVHR